MSYKRRDFLKLAGTATAGFTLASMSGNALAGCFAGNKGHKDFGIQLYGVRNMIGDDPKGVLKQIAGMGYKQIELFEQEKLGLYLGMGNKGLKQYAADLGMTIPSIHTNVFIDFEKKADEAAAIGVKYIIYNWEGPGKTLDDYKKMAESFNKMGEYANKQNIRFAFHNHDFTFLTMEGILPQDWIVQHTEKELVDFQIDLYWVVAAGQDPVKWINQYKDRVKLLHFKDRLKGTTERDGVAICELGTGTINFQDILNQVKGSAVEYYIVDQDTCNDRTDPLACIRTDANYMKQLKW